MVGKVQERRMSKVTGLGQAHDHQLPAIEDLDLDLRVRTRSNREPSPADVVLTNRQPLVGHEGAILGARIGACPWMDCMTNGIGPRRSAQQPSCTTGIGRDIPQL